MENYLKRNCYKRKNVRFFKKWWIVGNSHLSESIFWLFYWMTNISSSLDWNCGIFLMKIAENLTYFRIYIIYTLVKLCLSLKNLFKYFSKLYLLLKWSLKCLLNLFITSFFKVFKQIKKICDLIVVTFLPFLIYLYLIVSKGFGWFIDETIDNTINLPTLLIVPYKQQYLNFCISFPVIKLCIINYLIFYSSQKVQTNLPYFIFFSNFVF